MLSIVELETIRGESFTDITASINAAIAASEVSDGVCVLVVPHTTAAITLNSAIDGLTSADIIHELDRLVPKRVDFLHQYDTPADAAGHVKASLVGNSITLVVAKGRLAIGGSQSVLFCEFDGPRPRKVQVKLLRG